MTVHFWESVPSIHLYIPHSKQLKQIQIYSRGLNARYFLKIWPIRYYLTKTLTFLIALF